jgi:alanyl-tRNA synthetase
VTDTPTHLTSDGHRIVVAAAVISSGRLLAARRTRPAALAGLWELPGGKVEPREEPAAALVRELREELSIDTAVLGQVPGPLEGDWPLDEHSVLRVLRVGIESASQPRSGVAHDEVRWLAPEEVATIEWVPADVAAAAAAAGAIGTQVSFPAGHTTGASTVLRTDPMPDGCTAVVVATTPFHPVDHGWPDQPADHGQLGRLEVVDCLTGAIDDHGQLTVGDQIGLRRGDPSRVWVVVHVVTGTPPEVGREVTLEVDAPRRQALSAGHTACHLAALALNEVGADLWRKEPAKRDSRGFPDLDQIAIEISRIEPAASYDRYRFGKSLRKAGFDSVTFLERLDHLRGTAQELLDRWIAAGAAVRVDTGGDRTLTARRRWICELPGEAAGIACGGTHVQSLTELGAVRIDWQPSEAGLEVRTSVGS